MKILVPKLICLAGAFLLATAGSAQNFSLDWFTLDSGGGTSADGVFEVSGAITQPEAAPMTGGNFSLTGEFSNLIAAIPPSTTIFDNADGSDNDSFSTPSSY